MVLLHGVEQTAIIMIMLWGIGNTMVVYLAGIGEIPRDYYEAIEIDGGNAWHKFTRIPGPCSRR